MCKYEDLVTQPGRIVQGIYRFVGCRYPSNSIIAGVHSDSKEKGRSIKLSPEIELLCSELFEKLDRVYRSRSANLSIAVNG